MEPALSPSPLSLIWTRKQKESCSFLVGQKETAELLVASTVTLGVRITNPWDGEHNEEEGKGS